MLSDGICDTDWTFTWNCLIANQKTILEHSGNIRVGYKIWTFFIKIYLMALD